MKKTKIKKKTGFGASKPKTGIIYIVKKIIFVTLEILGTYLKTIVYKYLYFPWEKFCKFEFQKLYSQKTTFTHYQDKMFTGLVKH